MVETTLPLENVNSDEPVHILGKLRYNSKPTASISITDFTLVSTA